MSSIWAKKYVDDCVCVLSDLTGLPLIGVGRESWYIIIMFELNIGQRRSVAVLCMLYKIRGGVDDFSSPFVFC